MPFINATARNQKMSVDAYLFVWKLSKNQVTPLEKLLLLSIADRCGESGECWPSLARLEHDTGITRRAIISHRNKLIKQGILRFTGEYKGRSKQIPVMQLMVNEWREGKLNEYDEIDQCMPCTGENSKSFNQCTGCTSDQCTTCTLNLKDIEPKRKDISCVFEDFWNLYPKKKDKKDAKKIWDRLKLWKIAPLIIEKLSLQIEKEEQWKDPQFIPLPSTYLRGSRWEDEITPPKLTQNHETSEPKIPTSIPDKTLFSMFLGGIAADIKHGMIDRDKIPKISIEEWKENGFGADHTAYLKKLGVQIGKVSKKP